ncbi:Uncharacterised protein [Listeria grayi]|uniref:Uncharacterized protein n=1 Tax=Listeria grayi FSL F6-1183 TaxID=1265827 RepID=A0A829R7J5_LISGR|nr:hypothetical protein [Listeria grayi]EUJ28876.1 hypothetical protein LMUR_04495 [Listeria grayi FSL F6-1183]VEI35804.1 Uncharacterised protein [Listeria grayi]
MEERIYDLEDRVQDLELEVADLRKRLEETKKPAPRDNRTWWVLVPIVAIICGTIMSIVG